MLMFENYGERYGSSTFDDLCEVFYSLIKVKSINGAKGGRGIATGLCWHCPRQCSQWCHTIRVESPSHTIR
jgi:hypothetical protein